MKMELSVPSGEHPQELIYKIVNDAPLFLTVLPPTKKLWEKAPIVAVISGGGWQVQSREAVLGLFGPSVEQLRKAGVCVVSMDYRVTSLFPGVTVADEAGDVLDCLSYLHLHAQALGLDTDKVILAGHSAGGHIALLLAYAPGELWPAAYPDPGISPVGCLPFSAPCFLYPSDACPEPLRMEYDYIFPGGVYNDPLAHLWSPYEYISGKSPATLFVHGAADDLVPDSNSLASLKKGRESGADFSLIHPANGGHCLEPMREGTAVSPSYAEVQNQIASWVKERFEKRR